MCRNRQQLRRRVGRYSLPRSPFSSFRGRRVDSKSAFVKRFGDLVILLRVDPGNDAAQDLALAAACAAVEAEPVEVEAGLALERHPR